MFSTVKATEVTIGDEESTTFSTYVPFYTLFNYGYSQQIFTADEIGMAGTINSLSMWMYYTGSLSGISVSIYMAEVDDEDFASTSAWIALTEDDLVYSGTLNKADLPTSSTNLEATTIELENPFSYSGNSNLLIAIANNTGSYSSGFNCRVDAAPENAYMTLYAYRDASAYDITNPNVSGTRLTKRNVITLDITSGGTPVIPCDKPSGITASDIAAHQATLAWADGSGVYNVEYKKASDAEWTPLLSATTLLTADLTSLEANTDYQARVQSVCADNTDNPVSGWKTVSFKTMIGLPFAENFDASSSIPTGWVQKSGLLAEIMAGTASFSTGSGWSINSTSCGIFDSRHLYQNVYGSSKKHWIMLPRIPMEANTELTFDLAVTRSGCAEKTPGAQDDDKFVVLISTDSMATWTILRQWDNAGSEYVFDNISNTGEEVKIDLGSFAGENAHIALYAESTSGPTTGAGDNYFHIDNILIDYIPSCLKPTDLAVVPNTTTSSSVELGWTANTGEEAWILQYKKSSETAWQEINVTENPYLLANLEAYTSYDVQVAAVCDPAAEDGTSKFSKAISFKTAATAPFAESFNATTLPGDWTRYKVLLADVNSGDTIPTDPVTSGWLASSTTNGVFPSYGGHLKLQVYGTDVKHWIVSPYIEMNDANMQLTFDLALTKSTGSLQPAEAGQQADDKFAVLITTDNGESWEEIYTRDNVTTNPTYDQINCSAEGEMIKIDLSAYASEKIAFAFYGESTEAGGNNYLHIANISIDTIPDCEKPTGLQSAGVTSSSASFMWEEAEGATWAYGYVVDTFTVTTFVPADEDFTGSTVDNTVTIDELQENTKYIFFLRQDCGGAYSEYVTRSFVTLQTPATLPFEDDFEGAESWVLLNGDMTNNWVIGSATNNGGSKSLYVSDDHGVTNKYSHDTTTIYATKTFEIEEEGKYNASYDWKGQGESTWDLVRVALAPADVELEAGTALPSGLSSTSGNALGSELPAGWISLDGGKLNLQSDWQHNSVDADLTPGTYKVVIIWRNDGSGGTQTPAGAIDNFKFAQVHCVRPENVRLAGAADSLTTTSALIDWDAQGSEANWLVQYKKSADAEWTAIAEPVTAHPFLLEGLQPASSYDVQVAAWCNPEDSATISDYSAIFTFATECAAIASFPYSENFDGMEGVTSVNVLPVCWDYINTVTGSTSYDYYPTVYKGSTYANSGTNSLKLLSYYNYEGEMYAILPEMEGLNALRMKFNARAYSASTSYAYYDATFVVGVLNSPADTANFVAIDTITAASTTYAPFEVKFNNYEGTGKYIAIKMVSPDYIEYDYNGAYIDDIVIDSIPDCIEPASIKVVDVTTTSVKFVATAAAEGDSLSYALVLNGIEPTEFIGVTADTVLVEGLNGSTEYEIYLRTECANSHSLALSKVFQTKQVAVDLGSSFFEDFEGPNTWYGFNTAANEWVRGEAAHNGEGTHAMYVSNDGGATNAYTKTGPGIIYGAKLLNIEGGSYVFQFDWRAKGEGTTTLYDYMRAALVPATAELVAGGSIPTGFAGTTLPEGCIAIDNSQALNQSETWQTLTSDEVTVPAGTYYLAFAWKWDVSGGSDPAAAVDNISITKVLCGKPGTPTIEKANITATSAEIAWVCDPEQTSWILAMDTIADFNKDSVELQTVVTTNPYLVENLLPEHTYYVYVRANCGDDFSAWSARASFKTAKACQKPDGLDVTAITDSSAVITWNTYGQTEFILTYGIGNAYEDTVNVTGGTYTITGLDENTSYKVKVAAECDATSFSSAKTFKTACAAIDALDENFDGITGSTSSHVLPDCWNYINTGTSGTFYPTAYASATYAHSGTNSLRFYAYTGTSYSDQYAILPAINDLNGKRIKFYASKYSTYDATFTVGIMTDPADAATFVAIATLAPASAEYEQFTVSFDQYVGEGKYAAFKIEVPTTSSRYVHIDDVVVEEIPSCLEPADLAVSEITTTSATLNWESAAAQWQICLNEDSVNLIDVTAKPFVLDNLTAATNYEFKVRAICAVGDTSAWSQSMAFATECEILSAYPWSENFNGLAAGIPLCWDNSEGTTTTDTYKWNYYANATDTCLRFNSYTNSSNKTNILATPEFALTAPVLFSFDWKNPTGGAGLVMISNDGGLTMDTLASELTGIANWTPFEFNLAAYTGDTVVIYFHGTSNYGNGDAYLYLDNVAMEILPACPKSTGLHAEVIGDTQATFAWDAEEDVTWEYGLVLDTVAGFEPTAADFTAVTYVNEVTIDTLAPQTTYLFFMRKICASDKSPILYKSFTTLMLAEALPYDDDFEAGNSWMLVNGTLTNAWCVGAAATESGNALYISNDGGTTFEYTVTAPVIVYAAKAFNFDKAGSYTVSYDWRANGESNYDYLRVAIVPADVELAAATSVPSGFSTTGLPIGWKAADGGSKLNLSNVWQSKSVVVEDIVPGYYQLVFAWRNDNSTGTQSPAAVDNIHIQHLDYPTDFENADSNIGSNAVKFIRNNQVYILINGVVYNITGQKVEVK